MTDQTDYLKCADVLLSGHYRDVTTKDIALSNAYAVLDIAQTLRTMREDTLRIGMNLNQVAGKLTSDDGIGVGDLLADIAARPEIKVGGECQHEAWEERGGSRRCADCREYLGGVGGES